VRIPLCGPNRCKRSRGPSTPQIESLRVPICSAQDDSGIRFGAERGLLMKGVGTAPQTEQGENERGLCGR